MTAVPGSAGACVRRSGFPTTGATFRSQAVLQPCAVSSARAASRCPCRAGDIDGLELVVVREGALRLVSGELTASEHPRAARLHVGRQVRYPAGSSHGRLGGFPFAPATRSPEARDEWIGRDADARERCPGRVISPAWFLVRPSASVRNLASKLPGMAARRVCGDFEAAYGVSPVLMETHVAPEHSGSCFRAAGRGRA